MGAGQPQRSYHLPPDSSWLPPFITFCLLLLVMPSAKCKIGLVLTTVSESECKWASAQSLLAIASYVTAGCVVYAFP